MLDEYAAGIREFSDERLVSAHQKNVRLRADDLIEITQHELRQRGLLSDRNRTEM